MKYIVWPIVIGTVENNKGWKGEEECWEAWGLEKITTDRQVDGLRPRSSFRRLLQ